jgi:hypothetical protein
LCIAALLFLAKWALWIWLRPSGHLNKLSNYVFV